MSRSHGGGRGNTINKLRGGSIGSHTEAAVNNVDTKFFVITPQSIISALPRKFQDICDGRTVIKVVVGSKPLEQITKKFQIAKDARTDSQRCDALASAFTRMGCNLITQLQARRPSDGKVQPIMLIILPLGKNIESLHEIKSTSADKQGHRFALCSEELCFNIPEDGKYLCAHHQNAERKCTVCDGVLVKGSCPSCRSAANKAKDCIIPDCGNKRLINQTVCSNACQKKKKDLTFCQKCKEKVVVDTSQFDDREWHEDCQDILCDDCWKEPVKLCRYCQVRIARRGVQCLQCSNKKEKNKTKKSVDPEWFVEMKKELS